MLKRTKREANTMLMLLKVYWTFLRTLDKEVPVTESAYLTCWARDMIAHIKETEQEGRVEA